MWMFWGNLKTYWTDRLFCCPVLRILLTSSGFLKAWLTVESTYYFITQSLIKERKKKSNNIWRNKNKKTLYPSVVIIRFSAGISFQRSWIHVNKFWLINLPHPPTHTDYLHKHLDSDSFTEMVYVPEGQRHGVQSQFFYFTSQLFCFHYCVSFLCSLSCQATQRPVPIRRKHAPPEPLSGFHLVSSVSLLRNFSMKSPSHISPSLSSDLFFFLSLSVKTIKNR